MLARNSSPSAFIQDVRVIVDDFREQARSYKVLVILVGASLLAMFFSPA